MTIIKKAKELIQNYRGEGFSSKEIESFLEDGQALIEEGIDCKKTVETMRELIKKEIAMEEIVEKMLRVETDRYIAFLEENAIYGNGFCSNTCYDEISEALEREADSIELPAREAKTKEAKHFYIDEDLACAYASALSALGVNNEN